MIIGGLDDQINLLIWAKISHQPFSIASPQIAGSAIYKVLFGSFLSPLTADQPVLWLPVSFLSSVLGPNFYNLFLLFTILSSFLAALILFRKSPFRYFYAFVFTFSTFMWIHLGKHPALGMIWVFPIAILFLEDVVRSGYKLKSVLVAGLFLSISILTSQYFGYFLLIFTGFYFTFDFLYGKISLAKLVSIGTILIGTVLIVAAIPLYPYFKANYLDKPEVARLSASVQIQRPLSDFILFSSRPWFYILPSPKNPILGGESKILIDKITSSGYYYAHDYFTGEHDGSYFGFGLYFLLGLLIYISLRYKLFVLDSEAKYKVIKYLSLGLAMIVMSMPPIFTVSNITLYTPSYLLFRFFPMFRATSRISILVLLCLLVAISELLKTIRKNKPQVFSKLKYVVPVVLVAVLMETYVPLKIYNDSVVPEVYSFLGTKEGPSRIAVYPYNQTQSSFYWLPVHKAEIVNTRFYRTPDFDSETFTNTLITENGISDAQKIKVNYLVVFKNAPTQDISFFKSRPAMQNWAEFDDAYLFTLMPSDYTK